MNEEKMIEQYERLGEAIATEGMGYAIYPGGYIHESKTDDKELQEAIKKAREGMKEIESILEEFIPDI